MKRRWRVSVKEIEMRGVCVGKEGDKKEREMKRYGKSSGPHLSYSIFLEYSFIL